MFVLIVDISGHIGNVEGNTILSNSSIHFLATICDFSISGFNEHESNT
jgi:hypothetical protein